MYSSRMRTVHCSSGLLGGVSTQGGGCLPWGVCPGDVCLGDVYLGGGCLVDGVSALWTEFFTHACENITFPQLR